MKNIIGLFCLVFVLISTMEAVAGCKSDCKDEYESAVQDCSLMHSDADSHDELLSCIEDARDELENCKDECDS